MALILNIETSSDLCSVSLTEGEELKAFKSSDIDKSHSKQLAIFINDILTENSLKAKNLDAVAISEGPGSYTGLRIGVSTAKGICFGANIPLIAVNTLDIMAYSLLLIKQAEISKKSTIIPMIDARRNEVYCSVFSNDLTIIEPPKALILEKDSFSEYDNIILCGNGAEKAQNILEHGNFSFVDGITPSAKHMGHFSNVAYNKNDFVDVIYFEPYYLKDFVATTPKNKVINVKNTKND